MPNRDFFTANDLINSFLGYTYNKTDVNYPPVNIYALDEKSKDIFVDVAVAGFSKEEISVTCDDNKLVIKGTHSDNSRMKRNVTFVKKGISSKDFTLSWEVSPKYEVVDAELTDGILTVKLSYINQASIKTIDIK